MHESSGIAGKKSKGQTGKSDSGDLCPETGNQPGDPHPTRKRLSEYNDRDPGADRKSLKV